MAPQKNRTLKSVAGIVTLLGAVTALITAIVGPEGFSKLITASGGQGREPIVTPTNPNQLPGSPNVKVNGDKNAIVGGSSNRVGSIQQADHGNCNNIQASGQSVTITCYPSSNEISFPDVGLKGFPTGNNATATPVKLQASVEDLQRGSNRFTLRLTNATPDQSVHISTTSLALSDDQGNTYELDPWVGNNIGLSKVVPPNGHIKLDYTLANAIVQNASSVTFTLDDVWTQPKGSQFQEPLPSIQWETRL